jgi:hypothetical protein
MHAWRFATWAAEHLKDKPVDLSPTCIICAPNSKTECDTIACCVCLALNPARQSHAVANGVRLLDQIFRGSKAIHETRLFPHSAACELHVEDCTQLSKKNCRLLLHAELKAEVEGC